MIDRAKLRDLAQKLIDEECGDWDFFDSDPNADDSHGCSVRRDGQPLALEWRPVAKFIAAASPRVVKALIDMLDESERPARTWLRFEVQIIDYLHKQISRWEQEGRKPAQIAFTASLERQVARMIETAEAAGFKRGVEEAKAVAKKKHDEFMAEGKATRNNNEAFTLAMKATGCSYVIAGIKSLLSPAPGGTR